MAARGKGREVSNYTKYLTYNRAGFQIGDASKQYVWYPTGKDNTETAYYQAEIIKDEPKQVVVRLDDGSTKTVPKDEKNYLGVNPPKFDGVEDMGDLGHLNEPAVLHNIKKRYDFDLFHTYSGLFLVVINPYKRLPIYTPEIINHYRGKSRDKVAPHIFAMADVAYRAMLQERKNQSMLITGESGAGKTENTKKVIQYLTAIAGRTGGDRMLEDQLLEFNPILEAFGNAKTTKNNNSSRFGKFIELQFNSGGQIAGANTLIYLLEKSRVVFQGKNERNFHVFYQILSSSMPSDLKKQLHLTRPDDFFFLNQSGCTTVPGTDDAKEFDHSLKALDTLKISQIDRLGVWEALASILHLGNLPIIEGPRETSDLKDASALNNAAEHLGVDPQRLKAALIAPTILAGQGDKMERVVKTLNKTKALASRDALCKAIYGLLFLWVVKNINAVLSHVDQMALSIGVLDISGFEIFVNNSFEQLCINYTNEKLQQFFNHHMFTLEQEEYEREKIDWTFVNYGLDLQDTIDLIEKEPNGILCILNDESMFPDADDTTFTKKCHKQHEMHRNFRKPRFDANTFQIIHYAGAVEYQTKDFLEKNRDPLEADLQDLLRNSKKPFMKSLFTENLLPAHQQAAAAAAAAANKPANRKKAGGTAINTVAVQYKEQLTQLMDMLRKTSPHFIRCILPNLKQAPGHINDHVVLEQLKCNGVLEGIRIARKGWPNRIKYPEFLKRYYVLKSGTDPKSLDPKTVTKDLVTYIARQFSDKVDLERVRFGLTKIFFRAGQLAVIEQIREELISKMLIAVQAASRAYLARREFNKVHEQGVAVKTVQKNIRLWLELKEWGWFQLLSKGRGLVNKPNFQAKIDELEKKLAALEKEIAKLKADREKVAKDKADAESDLADLEKDISEARSKLTTLQDEVKHLKEDKDAAQRRLNVLNNDLSGESKTSGDLAKDKQDLLNALASLESTLSDLEKKNQALEDGRKKLVLERDAAQDKFEDEESNTQSLQKKADDLNRQLNEAKDAARDADGINDTLKAKIKQVEKKLEGTQEELSKETAERSALTKGRQDASTDLQTAQAELNEAKAAKDAAEATAKKNQTTVAELQASLDEERSKFTKSENALKALKRQQEELTDQVEEANDANAALDKTRTLLQQRLEDLEANARAHESGKTTAGDEARKVKAEVDTITRKLEDAEAALNRLRAEKKTAQDEYADAEARLEAERENNKKEKKKYNQKIAALQIEYDNSLGSGDANSEDLKKLEERIGELKNDAERADEAKIAADKQTEAAAKEISQLRQELDELNAQNALLIAENRKNQGEVDRTAEDLETKENARSVLEATNRRLTADVADIKKRLFAAASNQQRDDLFSTFLKDNSTLKKEVIEFEGDNRSLLRDLRSVRDRLNATLAQLEGERKAKQRLLDSTAELKKIVMEREQANTEMQSRIQGSYDHERSALENEIRAWEDKNTKLRDQISSLAGTKK